ncbi:MAG: sodium-dependent transporter [Dehalococcoidia bacterium]|nr:sodium-dependent transporter [Dehalococcoidia bacterium]
MPGSLPSPPSEASGSVLSAIADAALRPRPVWRSERAYVLATIASVVGLGSLWRFPYMAGLHGGGSFVLAYFVCVIVVGIPLAVLESGAGSLSRRSPVGLFRRAAGGPGVVIGWTAIALTVAIMSYYFVVTGWTLGYAFDAVLGRLTTFAEFTTGMATLWLFLIVCALVFAFLVREMSAFERASQVLMPVLLVIVVGMAVYGQTLEGAGEARSFYLGLDRDALLNGATWRAAAGQAFYSIGVGQGILIAYASYIPAGTNILRTTSIVAGTNALVALVAGLMVFPIVFTFGIAPDAGSHLSFTAFPRVFAEVGGGDFLAIAFFTLLFVAGFTSCLGMGVVVMSALRDETRLTRTRAARVVVGLVVLLGLPSALSFTQVGFEVAGIPFLDAVDRATGSGIMVVTGLVGTTVLALRLPRRRLIASFNAGRIRRVGGVRLRASWIVTWATLLPLVAAAIFGATLLG